MFGRKKQDEDPFAALRDGGTYQSPPAPGLTAQPTPAPGLTSKPTPAPAPALSPAPPVGLPRRRQRLGMGFGTQTLATLLVLGIVIAAIAVPLLLLGNAVHSATSVPSSSVPAFNSGPSPGSTNGAPAPAPAKPVSYLTSAGVRAGLTRVAKLVPGARLVLLRVAADSLSVSAMLPSGVAKQIFIGPSGTIVTAGPVTGERPIPISQIIPSVVGRLVVEMGRRFNVAPNQIDYMVISSPAGLPARWVVFSKAPAHPGFSATLSGANLAPLPG